MKVAIVAFLYASMWTKDLNIPGKGREASIRNNARVVTAKETSSCSVNDNTASYQLWPAPWHNVKARSVVRDL